MLLFPTGCGYTMVIPMNYCELLKLKTHENNP